MIGRALADLAAVLRAAEAWYRGAHHAVDGQSATADHAILYDEAYELADRAFDELLERAIGLSGDASLADPASVLSAAESVLVTWPSSTTGDAGAIATAALTVNDTVMREIDGTVARLKERGALTQGTESMLAQLADDCERLGYKLRQRASAGLRLAYTIQAPPADDGPYLELPEAYGQALYDGTVQKAAGHKYIKRVPYTAANGKRRYRYYYSVGHGNTVGHADHFVVGASFQHGKGHYHVTGRDGDKVTIRHDESGESRTFTTAELKDLLVREHGEKLEQYKARVRKLLEESKPGSHAEKRWRAHATKVYAGSTTRARTLDELVAIVQREDEFRERIQQARTEAGPDGAKFAELYATIRKDKIAWAAEMDALSQEDVKRAQSEITKRRADAFRAANEAARKQRMIEEQTRAAAPPAPVQSIRTSPEQQTHHPQRVELDGEMVLRVPGRPVAAKPHMSPGKWIVFDVESGEHLDVVKDQNVRAQLANESMTAARRVASERESVAGKAPAKQARGRSGAGKKAPAPQKMERRPDVFVRHSDAIDALEAAHPGAAVRMEEGLRHEEFNASKAAWMDEDLGLPKGTTEAVLSASKKWQRDGHNRLIPMQHDDQGAKEKSAATASARSAAEFGPMLRSWLRARFGLPPAADDPKLRKGFVFTIPQ